jgi:hypothetical protein
MNCTITDHILLEAGIGLAIAFAIAAFVECTHRSAAKELRRALSSIEETQKWKRIARALAVHAEGVSTSRMSSEERSDVEVFLQEIWKAGAYGKRRVLSRGHSAARSKAVTPNARPAERRSIAHLADLVENGVMPISKVDTSVRHDVEEELLTRDMDRR